MNHEKIQQLTESIQRTAQALNEQCCTGSFQNLTGTQAQCGPTPTGFQGGMPGYAGWGTYNTGVNPVFPGYGNFGPWSNPVNTNQGCNVPSGFGYGYGPTAQGYGHTGSWGFNPFGSNQNAWNPNACSPGYGSYTNFGWNNTPSFPGQGGPWGFNNYYPGSGYPTSFSFVNQGTGHSTPGYGQHPYTGTSWFNNTGQQSSFGGGNQPHWAGTVYTGIPGLSFGWSPRGGTFPPYGYNYPYFPAMNSCAPTGFPTGSFPYFGQSYTGPVYGYPSHGTPGSGVFNWNPNLCGPVFPGMVDYTNPSVGFCDPTPGIVTPKGGWNPVCGPTGTVDIPLAA